MDTPDVPLTAFQARLLFGLSLFSEDSNREGLSYQRMLEQRPIAPTRRPMLMKTVAQLRNRARPLVRSRTDVKPFNRAGRRHDIFFLNRENILINSEICGCLYFLYFYASLDH